MDAQVVEVAKVNPAFFEAFGKSKEHFSTEK
jgi:hypothetical protein